MQALMQDFPLTLHHIVWRMEKLFPQKQIVTKREHGLHRYTYGDLVSRARRLAAALARLGVRQGDRVATLAWNNYRHVELYYAVPCMGAVLHTLNLRLSPEQLAFIANGDEPRDGALDYETLLAAESPDFVWPELDERAPMAMCYTSGTTGHPKGVVYSHRSTFLHSMSMLLQSTLAGRASDVPLPIVPMFHANAWGLPYAAAMAGASFILPDRFMGDAEAMIELAISEGATWIGAVPTIWVAILARLNGRKLHVREGMSGGSAVPRVLFESLDREGIDLVHAWGMTETSPLATWCRPRSWHDGDPLAVRVTQGPPVPGVELRICDLDSGAELPWDGVAFGEIQVRGPWVCAGYHYGADPTRMTDDDWFRTGDVATVSPDGYVTIVDRAKDVIKSGGEWVSSVELENAIMAHPKVLEAAVIGLAHPAWQERPVGFVVPRPEFRGELTAEEILAHLSAHFMKWWIPDEIRFIDEVPKTSVGKFDKKALRARAEPLRV